jgi:O-antigen/teichoic acid export membrane protein
MFFKRTASVFVTQIIMFLVAFATSIVIARHLGPDGKGQLTLLTTFTGLLVLVTNLGIGSATIYYLNHRPESRSEVASSSVTLQMTLTLGTVAAAFALTPWILDVILKGAVSRPLFLLTLCLMPITVLSGAWNTIFLGLQETGKFNIMRMTPPIVHLVLLVVLTALAALGVLTVMMSSGIAAASTAVLGFIWLRQMNLRLRVRFSRGWGRSLLGYGLKGWLGNLSQYFNYRLDVFIVNLFVGVTGVGQYSVAVNLAETLWYIPNSVGTVLFPRTAADTEAAIRFTPFVARTTLFITLFAALVMAAIAYPLILLAYQRPFLPSVAPLLFLLPGVVFLSLGKVLSNDMAGHGKPQYGTIAAAASLVATIVLDFLLIPRMGITGAALASTFSYGLNSLILLWLYVRFSGNSVSSVLFVRMNDFRLYRDILRKQLPGFGKAKVS